MSTPQLPNLETLFKDTFQRFSSRFLSYFLAYAISFGASIAIAIIAGLLFFLHLAIFGTTQSIEITTTSAIITGIAFIVGAIYVHSWLYLVMMDVIIDAHPSGVINTFKKTRPWVWGFIWFAIVSWFFISGIILLGLLGLVIGALILGILWGVWSIFGGIVYLEKRHKGLANLWASYHLVNTRFWGIFGRFIMIFLAIYVLYILSALMLQDSPAVLTVLQIILGLVVTPFLLSYTYEIYRHLPQEDTTTPSTPWIVTSILGWVVAIGFTIFFASAAVMALPEAIENIDLSEFEEEAILMDDTEI